MRFLNRLSLTALAVSLCAMGYALPAPAVVVMGSQGNNFINAPPSSGFTNTPTGVNVESYEGLGGQNSIVGVPISSRYLLSAYHLGTGSTVFHYNNDTNTTSNYNIQFVSEIGDSDIALWEIAPSNSASFTWWAPLDSTDPTNLVTHASTFYVLGDGTVRGSAVTGGWAQGASTPDNTAPGIVSWGTNTIATIYTQTDPGDVNHNAGNYIAYGFYQGGGSNEAILSSGDSGGGLFVKNLITNQWELAGINYGVNEVWDTSGPNTIYNADSSSLYNTNGYYMEDGTQINNDPAQPEYSFDSEIYGANYNAIIALIPEPASGTLLLGVLIPLAVRRARRTQS
jgi:hypothetical protein